MLSALKKWSSEKNTKIVTISTDKDFEAFCNKEDRFSHFPTLYEFLNFALTDEQNLVSVIHTMVEKNKELISGHIEKAMEEIGFYVGDADGEVFFESIIECNFLDISVVGLNKNRADIFCLVDVALCLDASYWDPDSWTSIRDGGRKEVFYHHRIEGRVEKTFTIEIEFEIKFDAKKFKLIDFKDLIVNSGEELEYSHYIFEDYK